MKRYFLAALFLPCFALADVHYTLEPLPAAKSLRVAVQLEDAKAIESFRIPAWTPGMYVLMNYQDKISDIKATDAEGRPLHIEPVDKRKWVVTNPSKGPVTFSYRVLGDDGGLGFFGANVRDDKAFVNGASTFMYVDGRLTERSTLRLKLPAGWDVATAMSSQGTEFVAEGYDEFIDHPIQLGKFVRRNFTVEGIPFEAIYVAPDNKPRCDVDRETERLRKQSIPTVRMFGGASFKKYLYIIHLAVGDFSGGLEHRACNVQAVPNLKPLNLDTLATHEYFHAWNVKQIRPAVLGPFDYTKQVRTGNLWFAEGVTDYYAYKHTYASGLFDSDWLLSSLAAQISDYESGQTRLTKTVEDSSRENWENGGFGVGDLSYYTKGLLIGWIFDAEIRKATGGRKSLDDVMRTLYARCMLPNPGYGEDELIATINTVAGTDLTSLYMDMVRSTKPLPYDRLQDIGLMVIKPGEVIPGSGSKKANRYSVVRDPEISPETAQRLAGWLAP